MGIDAVTRRSGPVDWSDYQVTDYGVVQKPWTPPFSQDSQLSAQAAKASNSYDILDTRRRPNAFSTPPVLASKEVAVSNSSNRIDKIDRKELYRSEAIMYREHIKTCLSHMDMMKTYALISGETAMKEGAILKEHLKDKQKAEEEMGKASTISKIASWISRIVGWIQFVIFGVTAAVMAKGGAQNGLGLGSFLANGLSSLAKGASQIVKTKADYNKEHHEGNMMLRNEEVKKSLAAKKTAASKVRDSFENESQTSKLAAGAIKNQHAAAKTA